MTSLVLDCSATLAWVFEDEWTASAADLLDRVETLGALVPAIWPFEIANVLTLAERRKRIPPGGSRVRLDRLATLPVTIDPDTQRAAWDRTLDIATGERLTVYDASYLELAIRLSLPLATKDRDLATAAGRCGVGLIPLSDA